LNNTFVLRASPDAQPSCEALAARLQGRGVRVMDRSDRMLLVEGREVTLTSELTSCAGWSLVPQAMTSLPKPPALKPTATRKTKAASSKHGK
jgi:hypothetical protein